MVSDGTNPVGSWLLTVSTGAGIQDPVTYKGAIDGNFAVAQRIVTAFAPQPNSPAAMNVVLLAGFLTLSEAPGTVEVAQQTSGAITAPVSNYRYDTISISATTGAVTVTTGTEGLSPAFPPSVPAGQLLVGLIHLVPGQTSIAASDITDLRAVWGQNLAGRPRGGNVNKIRNATGTVDSRGLGSAPLTVTTAGGMTLDGWYLVPAGASVTAAQVAGVGRAKKALKITGAASVSGLKLVFPLESIEGAEISGRTVTLQVTVQSANSGGFTPQAYTKLPQTNDNDWTGSPTTDLAAVNLQPVTDGATTTLSYTYTVGNNATRGVSIVFDFGNHWAGNTHTLTVCDPDIQETPGAIVGLANNPPIPDLRTADAEIDQCARYLPSWVPGATTQASPSSCAATSATAFGVLFEFLTHTWKAPTGISVDNVAHFEITDYAATTVAAVSGLTFNARTSTAAGFLTGTVASGLTANKPYLFESNNSATSILWTGAEINGST